MAEKKIADGTAEAESTDFVSDTTGNEPLNGTVHVMQQKMQSGAPSNKALSPSDSMNKAELVAMANAAGVGLDGNETKADLIAKIEKAQG